MHIKDWICISNVKRTFGMQIESLIYIANLILYANINNTECTQNFWFYSDICLFAFTDTCELAWIWPKINLNSTNCTCLLPGPLTVGGGCPPFWLLPWVWIKVHSFRKLEWLSNASTIFMEIDLSPPLEEAQETKIGIPALGAFFILYIKELNYEAWGCALTF